MPIHYPALPYHTSATNQRGIIRIQACIDFCHKTYINPPAVDKEVMNAEKFLSNIEIIRQVI